MTRRFLPGFIIALGLLALGLLVAFTVGRYPVTLAELFEVLVSRLAGRPPAVPPAVENVVLLVRGPRVVAAALGANRTRRDGENDVIDPVQTCATRNSCSANVDFEPHSASPTPKPTSMEHAMGNVPFRPVAAGSTTHGAPPRR